MSPLLVANADLGGVDLDAPLGLGVLIVLRKGIVSFEAQNPLEIRCCSWSVQVSTVKWHLVPQQTNRSLHSYHLCPTSQRVGR